MKLRNKKTGKIKSLSIYGIDLNIRDKDIPVYYSLKELNEEWEDYEESKDFYYIQPDGFIHWVQCKVSDYELKKFQVIGNYFKTKEETEKSVEMLKAWKRLKDKGFKFLGVRTEALVIDYDIPKILYMSPAERKEFYEDLRFVFGGEE